MGGLAVWAVLGSGRGATLPQGGLTRLHAELPDKTMLSLGRGSAVALSPDGSTLVFVAVGSSPPQLFTRALDRFNSTPLPGTEGATNPFFSPDGKWVGFFAGGRLKKVALSGGQPVTVCEAPNARGEAWGMDDLIYFTPTSGSAVWRVAATGGIRGDHEAAERRVQSSLAACLARRQNHPVHCVERHRVRGRAGCGPVSRNGRTSHGGHRRQLCRYLPGDGTNAGYLVYARASGLLAAPFDTTRLQVTASPVPILDGVVTNLSGGAHFAFSSSGSLAYVAGGLTESTRAIALVDRSGTARTLTTIRGMSLSLSGVSRRETARSQQPRGTEP